MDNGLSGQRQSKEEPTIFAPMLYKSALTRKQYANLVFVVVQEISARSGPMDRAFAQCVFFFMQDKNSSVDAKPHVSSHVTSIVVVSR